MTVLRGVGSGRRRHRFPPVRDVREQVPGLSLIAGGRMIPRRATPAKRPPSTIPLSRSAWLPCCRRLPSYCCLLGASIGAGAGTEAAVRDAPGWIEGVVLLYATLTGREPGDEPSRPSRWSHLSHPHLLCERATRGGSRGDRPGGVSWSTTTTHHSHDHECRHQRGRRCHAGRIRRLTLSPLVVCRAPLDTPGISATIGCRQLYADGAAATGSRPEGAGRSSPALAPRRFGCVQPRRTGPCASREDGGMSVNSVTSTGR